MFRLTCLVLAAGLTGCTVWSPEPAEEPEERRGPITPVDAFEEAEEPRRDTPAYEDPDGLSRDIERLQDARRKYENERAREAVERRRRRAECLEREDSRRVPIEDGSDEPISYCAPPAPKAEDGANGTE